MNLSSSWTDELFSIRTFIFFSLRIEDGHSAHILTSNRRRPDQTSTPNMSFGCWEAELTWYGSVGLGGIKHGRTEVRRWGVVHLRRRQEKTFQQ